MNCNSFIYKVYDSEVKGPTILCIGGVHGDEPAGSVALNSYDFENKVKCGKVIVAPSVNWCGLKSNNRYLPNFIDINRYFNDGNYELKNLANKSDLVIDFHEGYEFHIVSPWSIGSTISSYSVPKMSELCINNINKNIEDENKKWVHIKNKEEIDGSFRDYCDSNNIKYMLIETTGKLNAQPLKIRVKQNFNILDTILSSVSRNPDILYK